MADIFLSYAREDRSKAQRLAEIFEARGLSIWWDTRLQAGEVWDEVIERELDAACCVVVLWSTISIRKHWVRVEAHEGLTRKILVPACLESVKPPLAFRLVQWQDLTSWAGQPSHPSLNSLVAAAERTVREERARRQSSPPPQDQLTRPSWASAIGRDRYGLWVEIRVPPITGSPIVQRLRWIPRGQFQMGSPEGEAGRYDDEGPQHRVTLSQGFWLFDTPCTQALWEAVMGENPSRFRSPARPVEQVSWEDVQTFLKRIEEKVPELGLELPTEAQWEYACRAGTGTATYAGDLKIVGYCNAPGLDAIPWYSGNSGVGFELNNGEDSSGWPEKQYSHGRAGTHPVKLKEPNAWGLYDMLGNVREWCADGWRNYGAEAETDPHGPLQAGADRVLRGGSWYDGPRDVRSASRGAHVPRTRGGLVGFRCARVPS